MAPHKYYTLCDGIYLSESAKKKLTDESLKWEDRKPIGIRFNPSDRALAGIVVDTFFDRPGNIILSFFRLKNVYEHEPWNLSKFAHEFGEGKSYFFTSRKKKYGKGKNIARTAPGGFWRKTGSDSSIEITDSSIGKLSVAKTSLTFYKEENSGKEEKTGWLMKEYFLKMPNYENFKGPDDSDPWVLCVVYFHNDGKQKPSMPNMVVKSFQVPDASPASSPFYPPMTIQKSLHPYYLQDPFAEHDNPGNCHFPLSPSILREICGNISNSQLYPSSNPGMTTLQQRLPIYSEQNIVMGSQGATYRSSSPEPVSGTDLDQSLDPFINNLLNQQLDFMDDLQIQDLDQSRDPFINNFLNQQTDFIYDQPQPDPCENSNSIVCPPTGTIMIPNWPFRAYLDSWLQSGNENESNQQQQPSSHSSINQIIQQQQQQSDSGMTWNPNQQNPAEITPTINHHLTIFDEYGSMEIESLLLAPAGNRDMHETEDNSAAWTG